MKVRPIPTVNGYAAGGFGRHWGEQAAQWRHLPAFRVSYEEMAGVVLSFDDGRALRSEDDHAFEVFVRSAMLEAQRVLGGAAAPEPEPEPAPRQHPGEVVWTEYVRPDPA